MIPSILLPSTGSGQAGQVLIIVNEAGVLGYYTENI